MPSSVIFVGLVVLWLLILVPAVARRQQEVARLSPALLSGRVLERPMRHRLPEVGVMERLDDRGATTVGELVERRGHDEDLRHDDLDHDDLDHDDLDHEAPGHDDPGDENSRDDDLRDEAGYELDDEQALDEDDREWERPPARYRPGRGGYDPEAAAVAAHAKYAFRQRVVLGLLVLLLASGVAALLVTGLFWWATGLLGAGLVGYLTYLRRQVRIEESIRDRRAARLAGTRRSAAADDPDLDDWARRGREAAHPGRDDAPATADAALADDEDHDWTADDGEPSRIRGTGEPLGVLPARRRTTDGAGGDEPESSLPRLDTAPPPPIPAGTSLVDVDDEEQLDAVPAPNLSSPSPAPGLVIEHRRAVGE